MMRCPDLRAAGSDTMKQERCSFVNAIHRKCCPHYRPGRTVQQCHGYETEVTSYRTDSGSVITIYHCCHDPLPIQMELL